MSDPTRSPDPGQAEKRRRPHLLVQAPVRPLDVDGLTAVVVGMLIFAGGAVVTWIEFDALVASGRGWWLGSCLCGLALGVIGLVHCARRRARRLRDDNASPAD